MPDESLRRRTASRAIAFWLVALAFTVTMLGTTLPTPLYVYYQRLLGFSNLTSTVVFASYAGGVLTALVLFGRVSDTIGRRRTLLPGLAFAVISDVIFLGANDLSMLILARVFSGLSAGIFTGTATATLVDLAKDDAREHATLVATVANMAGLGAGPLLAGTIAHFSRSPLHLPFELHLVLLALVTLGVWTMPEPVPSTRRASLSIARPRVPADVRHTFVRAAMAGFTGFAVLGLFTAVSPTFVRRLIGVTDPALSGAVAGTIFVASALGQILLVRRLGRHALPVGCAGLLVGMGLLIAALAAGSLALLVSAALVAGLGQGVSFRAGLAALNAQAPPEQRAEVASAFFVVAYTAISVPIVGVGLLADSLGLLTAGIAFGVVMALVATITLVALRRR